MLLKRLESNDSSEESEEKEEIEICVADEGATDAEKQQLTALSGRQKRVSQRRIVMAKRNKR